MKSLIRLVLAVVLLHCATGGLNAASLRVGVNELEPFAKSEGGVWSGLSIDIWEKVAGLNKWEYEYVSFPDENAALAAQAKGEVDVIVSPVPITLDAVKKSEFSQPYFRSGLQIMVSEARAHSVAWLIELLKSLPEMKIVWVVLGLVAVMTVVVTLFERKHNPDFPKTWKDGLAEAFYYVVSLALTGHSTYKGFPGVLGRLMLVFWMILGMVMVIYLTSTITATMTAEKIQSHIHSPEDLPGKVIGAIKGTRAVDYLRINNIQTTLYPNIEEAVNGLVKGDVRAIVGPAPTLQYYDFNHPDIPITEVGRIFKPYNYGFAFPTGSAYRLDANAALLKLQETGIVNDLAQKYFGSVYQP